MRASSSSSLRLMWFRRLAAFTLVVFVSLDLPSSVVAFVTSHSPPSHRSPLLSSLSLDDEDAGPTRRELIRGAALAILAAGEGIPFLTAIKSKADGKLSSSVIAELEGTWLDPNHPRGYRRIAPGARVGEVAVELQDEASSPVDSAWKLGNPPVGLFDFSPKGGSTAVTATIDSHGELNSRTGTHGPRSSRKETKTRAMAHGARHTRYKYSAK